MVICGAVDARADLVDLRRQFFSLGIELRDQPAAVIGYPDAIGRSDGNVFRREQTGGELGFIRPGRICKGGRGREHNGARKQSCQAGDADDHPVA